jgi:signal transduction histidine kinase
MNQETKGDNLAESPARRLGVLYVASFSVIVLISAVNQAFILRAIAWQSGATAAVGRVARDRSFDRPLSFAALALLATDTAGERGEMQESLRRAILESGQNTTGTAEPGDGRSGAHRGLGARSMQHMQRAQTHRLAALQAAETLLSVLDGKGPALAQRAESRRHIDRIIREEEAENYALGEAAQASAADAADHVEGLNTSEFVLFGLVLLVLVFEGLFVVNPAVKRIQRFMDDLSLSHAELKAYAAKLERSNAELQDFASVASHDLQEPLRKVQAFSDRLRSRCAATIDNQGRDYLDRVQNAAARMQTLINDLLTYCRVATKAQPFVSTDLVTVTREVVSDLEARIEQVKGQVVVGELPTLDADPLQVRQLMQNLIGNSLKYCRPEVPPVVKVWSKHLAHDPAAAEGVPPRQFCQIMVEDNGIGFEEVYTERIFTIFQRLHGRTEYEGTGVGLAVCRKIVERHGGTITARSTPGSGSTFLVSLPIHQQKEMTANGHES